ncbi:MULTISPECIES: HesA/MoeB/ThiF family protein [unclassified Photobacterium]|uniref:HesA/MoeB/ThiF family protein n=1 Tax=unclassified Photobacterium TaxID=2628852 RepID=UPI000D17792F|nr:MULTISPECIES: HesA/MoeB/ThiF family protein [unclassified Photobacterium]PSV29405.1 molybdopterin-synthase adenylyltransferase MoeB [Photobacterium sp. GB-72]PSV35275.1 molybdopterin-synthase adenylyltransferase MoeB [Photobacterium sp. GB-27]PSV51560.1 molybdopterin-synthase adenylyltransferase MoeB [Photobacterium sp. GB-1]
MTTDRLSDTAFIRYNRQIMLEEMGEQGQLALNNAKVLIVGAGGLGSAAAMYLAAAGVGLLVIADDDEVESSNLQRQVIYRETDVSLNKAQAACDQLLALNPLVRTRAVKAKLAGFQLVMEVQQADIVLDCSDNWATRYAVNQACYQHQTPLIAGASIGWQGQLLAFDFRQASPCYQCVFPFSTEASPQDKNCRSNGVMGPVVGTIGTLQALNAIKAIAGVGEVGFGLLQQFNGLTGKWQQVSIDADSGCPVCGQQDQREVV